MIAIPLEWRGDFAHTRFGMFYFLVGADGGCILERHEGSSVTKSFHRSHEDAKSAAQIDFERRVQSAINDADGPWIKLSDHEAAMDVLRAEIDALKAELDEAWAHRG